MHRNLGVHISFVRCVLFFTTISRSSWRANPRSTNLDSWSLLQLRTLKVGGNGAIADFFTKHGGQSLLPPGNSDARARYTSRQAGLYKEELARRIDADAQRWAAIVSDRRLKSSRADNRNPHGIHIDGLELTPLASQTPSASTDDFFDTWDKPAAKPSPASSSSAKPAGPPGIGSRSGTSSPAPAAVKPVTRAQPITRPAPASRTSGSTTQVGQKVSKLGASKLGAKKATTGINFEEAQKKALEEEERIKRLGYDKRKEEEEAAAVKEREAERRRLESASRSSTPASGYGGAASTRTPVVDDKPAVARLGFGQTIGQAPVQQQKA